MAVYDLSTGAPSKQYGLKVGIGETFFDANGNVFKAERAKRRTSCTGCHFENFKTDPANEIICRHLVCADCWRKDRRAVVFKIVVRKR